jgi:hypothetical protein
MSTSELAKFVKLSTDERGEPIAVADFHGQIVAHCADSLAMHARDRAALPLATVADTEARIRRQREAVRSLESHTAPHVATWWEAAVESADPWKAWAALFLIGSDADTDTRENILRALDAIPADDERWMHAAEALALTPARLALGQDLARSPGSAARAVGIDMLSRSGGLPAEIVKEHLGAAEPAVVASAARSAARMGLASALVPELLRCMRAEDAGAAWEAARALTLAGEREPYFEVRGGGALAAVLGASAVELLIMAGEDTDIDAFEALIAGVPMTPELLSAVARFGNVTAWSFLAHYLADADLVGPAVSALRTLFGDIVPEAEEASFAAWQRAIGEQDLMPTLRYRAGKPWRPSLVVAECMSGSLSRIEVGRRVDELAARTGVSASVDLGQWEPDARGAFATFAREIESRDVRWRAGAWR